MNRRSWQRLQYLQHVSCQLFLSLLIEIVEPSKTPIFLKHNQDNHLLQDTTNHIPFNPSPTLSCTTSTKGFMRSGPGFVSLRAWTSIISGTLEGGRPWHYRAGQPDPASGSQDLTCLPQASRQGRSRHRDPHLKGCTGDYPPLIHQKRSTFVFRGSQGDHSRGSPVWVMYPGPKGSSFKES